MHHTPRFTVPRTRLGQASVTTVDVRDPAPKRRGPLPMLASAANVVGGKIATMGLGFLFWVVAARLFPEAEVGLAAGAVTAMMLCTQLAILGVGSALITRYPDHRQDPRALFDNAFSLTSWAAVAGGALALGAAALFLDSLGEIPRNPLFAIAFMLAVLTGTLGILLDQTSIALGRGDQVFARGLAFGGTALVVLVLAGWGTSATGAAAIFAPWVVAGIVMCAAGGWQLHRSLGGYVARPRVSRPMWKDLTRVGIPNWALTMTERAPGLIFPIVVVEVLSKEDNAYWYTAWMMAWVLFVVPISVGLTLFAEATNNPERLRRAVRTGLGSSLAVGVVGAALLALLAPWLLHILGAGYSDAGTPILRILVLSVVPLAFTQAYFAICRSQRRLGEALTIGLISAVASIAAGWLAASRWGLEGIAWAWTATQTVIGVVAAERIWAMARGVRTETV